MDKNFAIPDSSSFLRVYELHSGVSSEIRPEILKLLKSGFVSPGVYRLILPAIL